MKTIIHGLNIPKRRTYCQIPVGQLQPHEVWSICGFTCPECRRVNARARRLQRSAMTLLKQRFQLIGHAEIA